MFQSNIFVARLSITYVVDQVCWQFASLTNCYCTNFLGNYHRGILVSTDYIYIYNMTMWSISDISGRTTVLMKDIELYFSPHTNYS